MTLSSVSLSDKYTQPSGQIYLSGIQALVRLPMLQRQLDRQQKLNTAGLISGYRGSPLGGLDKALWEAESLLEGNNILFQSAINEDLGATALWGSQQTNLYQGALFDGVFGMWYGKGPGVDRCGDVFKHANAAGTSPFGGVLAIAGDDHGAKSSTLPHQSEQAFITAMMPVLNPAGVQEILDFGLYGWALSRYSGCWVGMKAVTECMDSSATVDIDPHRMHITTPAYLALTENEVHIRWPDSGIDQERRLLEHKLAAAKRFCAANDLNRICIDSKETQLTIVTSGKAYLDTREALLLLGLDERKAVRAGLRLIKIGMTWPLEIDSIKAGLSGVRKVLVIEEKLGIIEEQLKAQLYHWPTYLRPTIIGKEDEKGKPLISASGETQPNHLALIIGERINKNYPAINKVLDILHQEQQRTSTLIAKVTPLKRTPFYCAGCPHNSSTVIPDGSRGIGGIGCHYMVQWMDRSTNTFTHMGGEGANWIGQAPFTTTEHVFQNLGDGTYFHSGLLAIRAAIASKVNITYKILYNDAVAMTGGQQVDGQLSVAIIVKQLIAEGITKIAVVSDLPENIPQVKTLDKHVLIRHRNELDSLQKQFRHYKGVSVIIYQQTCAAEKRRRRKRGTMPEPKRHVFINSAVCEGCGDCSKQSNCLAVTAVDTELGRKRQIDQDSCNKDFSCLKGFCPSFVSVLGGRTKQPSTTIKNTCIPELPTPVIADCTHPRNIVIAGIGGTGIVTTAAMLGLAAHIENKRCRVLDMTGLAQKFGAVVSHIRIANHDQHLATARIPNNGAHLLIGCDLLVSAESATLATLNSEAAGIINQHKVMTGAFTKDPQIDFPAQTLLSRIETVIHHNNLICLNAHHLSKALLGNSKTLNLLLLGHACQNGQLPVSAEAIEQAIVFNNQLVEQNLQSFRYGRWLAFDPKAVMSLAKPENEFQPLQKLDDIVQWRKDYLTQYQHESLANHYQQAVNRILAKEQYFFPNTDRLAKAVANNYFKLLAYKDEYEVARLFTDKSFQQQLNNSFEGGYTLRFHFAPSWLPAFLRNFSFQNLHFQNLHFQNNAEQKITVGRWVLPLLKLLAAFKFLRNTPLDPFGYTHERQWERRMIRNYEQLLQQIEQNLHRSNYPTAVELAELPKMVSGYGHIKLASIKQHEEQRRRLLQRFRHPEQDRAQILVPATR
ncbi:MAG: indolepyruvate ferredoxin oxidoreductase family protein [Pseudomonadales bacterium]